MKAVALSAKNRSLSDFQAAMKTFKAQVKEDLIVKDRGTLGPGPRDARHIRILNRVVSYVEARGRDPDMILYEADERHVELLIKAYGMKDGSKSKAVPWDKADRQSRHPPMGKELDPVRSREFKSNCMRHLFLALDRPDIQYIAKEISRAMANPTVFADETLKSSVRYLLGHRRLVWKYARQEAPTKVEGLSDSTVLEVPHTVREDKPNLHYPLSRHPNTIQLNGAAGPRPR